MSSRKPTPSSVFAGSSRRGLSAALVLLGVLALAPAVAQAGVGASATPTFPDTVTVGDVGVSASIALTRKNSTPNVGDTNLVCNAGDTNPCNPAGGIMVVPTCSSLIAGVCDAAGADPGVFKISATAIGVADSDPATVDSCVDLKFTTAVLSDAFGTVRFTPTGGRHVTLPTNASTCDISFKFDVLKSPTGDQDPGTPGNQTGQETKHVQCVSPCRVGNVSNNGAGTSNGTTVLRALPSIATVASPDISLGGQLTDQATVSGLFNPVAGATVTFRLYPPSDASCAGAAVFANAKVVGLSGTTATATSDAYTPTVGGVYRWVATYDGDVNNLPIRGTCGEATETRTVSVPPPPPPAPPPPPPPPPTAPALSPAGARAQPPTPAKGVANVSSGGHTGCAGTPFRVNVTGTGIRQVVFTLDGKPLATLRRANRGKSFSVLISPGKLKHATHRVLARSTFISSTATKPKTMRVVFSRCARSAPQFTG